MCTYPLMFYEVALVWAFQVYALNSCPYLRGLIDNQGYIFLCECSSSPCSQWLKVCVRVCVSRLVSFSIHAGDEFNEWRAEH